MLYSLPLFPPFFGWLVDRPDPVVVAVVVVALLALTAWSGLPRLFVGGGAGWMPGSAGFTLVCGLLLKSCNASALARDHNQSAG